MMQQNTRPDGLDRNSATPLNRSQSLTGERVSMTALSPIHSSPPPVNPLPAYIAPSAASGIITGEHQSHSTAFAAEQLPDPMVEVVQVSPASLSLINSFLDQLLYNFLSTARSTSLVSLRPAVTEVLKPRLAKDAIAGADEELKEFLGGGDDEELTAFHGGQEPRGDWDLEHVWKLTRLRCMVYTRLGDMEEDDEDEFIEQEQLDGSAGGPRRFSSYLGTVSPAAAIFLTSIIEFVGEQTLLIAGEAARIRVLSRMNLQDPNAQQTSAGQNAERLVVEEGDTEKIALDRTFGRLWRTWRRRVRSPSHSMSRPISRDSFYRRGHSSIFAGSSRDGSVTTIEDTYDREDMRIRPNVAEVLHEQDPSDIPLPMTENDVNEIEIPGIVRQEEDTPKDHSKTPVATVKLRPQSMFVFPSGADLPTPTSPLSPDSDDMEERTAVGRVRSRSLPTPMQTPYASPLEEPSAESTFVTPLEAANPMEYLNVPDSNEEHLKTPTGDSQPLRSESTEEGEEEHSKPGIVAGLVAGAVSVGAAVAAATHILTITKPDSGNDAEMHKDASDTANKPDGAIERQDVEGDLDEEANARTPMASTMNVPQISQHLVCELSGGNNQSKRTSRASEIYVYVKQPHHGRDPSLTTTEAGDDCDYRNDPLDHEVGTQGVVDPEDLALSDNEAQTPPQKEEPKAFVLSPPPVGKNRAPEYPVKLEDVNGPRIRTGTGTATTLVSPTSSNSHTPGAENGVPPLTPLRELMEAAHDTSDEASRSSTTPSQKHDSLASQERAPSGQSGRSDTRSSYIQNKHSSASSRFSENRNQVVVLPQPSTTTSTTTSNIDRDRAGVQRVTPPPLTPREAGATRAQRSESIGSIDKRPLTGGSTTSRLSRKQTLPLRTSIDGAGINSDSQRDTVGPDSFDNLVKSGQTIQYTLTPQNMREMESPGSPRWSNKPRSQTADLADFLKNTGPPGDDERPKTGRSIASTKGVNGLRSHPLDPSPQSPTEPAITLKTKSTDLMDATQRPKRKILGMPAQGARDARVEKSTTRDFADFIRSTGPERPQQLPTTISARPSTANTDSAPRSVFSPQTTTTKSGENSPKISRSQTVSTNGSSAPKRSGSKLEARPAALPQGIKSADLIEFIREGPPHDPRDSAHRVPRTIGPFRTTMDSDEISALVGAGAVIDKDALARVSVASTQESSVPTVSVHSSSNSRTGLLDSTNHAGQRISNHKTMSWSQAQTQAKTQAKTQDDNVRPQRKQRRVRDPYAIDTDSEDEVRDKAPKPKRDEESLIDFLRNVAPPSEAQITPQLLNTSSTASAVAKKNSAPNIKDRIMRKSSVTAGGPNGRQRSEPMVLPVRLSSSGALQGLQSAPPPPRAVSPHLSQTGSRLDSYKPTQPTYAAHVDRVRNKGAAQGQSRAGRSERTSTAELADFLKNSGPPATSQTYVPNVPKEETGFSRMFSRKKKPSGLA